MKTAKFDESFEDKKTFLFRHIFQWECKWAWTVKCSYVHVAGCDLCAPGILLQCYILNFSYHILLLAAYRAWKIWNNYKPPPFYSYFRPEEETTKCKKMNYESRNITPKMLIWICSILPCLVICDAFISQINLGLTIDCCNLNCSIVNQSSCKLCSTLTRISFNYSRMFLHYLFTD